MNSGAFRAMLGLLQVLSSQEVLLRGNGGGGDDGGGDDGGRDDGGGGDGGRGDDGLSSTGPAPPAVAAAVVDASCPSRPAVAAVVDAGRAAGKVLVSCLGLDDSCASYCVRAPAAKKVVEGLLLNLDTGGAGSAGGFSCAGDRLVWCVKLAIVAALPPDDGSGEAAGASPKVVRGVAERAKALHAWAQGAAQLLL